MKKKAKDYPRITALGIAVQTDPIAHIRSSDLHEGLTRGGIDQTRFSELYGIQTRYIDGPYPWDVEAVLERMASGKL